MTTEAPNLTHAAWCKGSRIETTEHPGPAVTTTHCVDCGAHQAHQADGTPLPAPNATGALITQGIGDMDIDMRQAGAADVPGYYSTGGAA